MKTFYIGYRDNEIKATIKAKNMQEAYKKFIKGKCKYEVNGDVLWHDFIQIYDKNGNELI